MRIDFIPADENAVTYRLGIAYSELFGDYTLNDLTDDEFSQMQETLSTDYALPTVDMRTTEVGTKLILIDETGSDSDYASLLTIYHGFFIELSMDKLDGSQITDAEIDTGVAILSSLALIKE